MKKASEYIPIRVTAKMNELLEKTARAENKSKSLLIREYIDKGLRVDGFTQNERSMQDSIALAVKQVLDPAVERLASISAKNAWMSGAEYFLLIYALRILVDDEDLDNLNSLVENSRKLGIAYLKTKDASVDDFIKKALKDLGGKNANPQ